ncbi:MAG: site-specific DNA-methyltransferase [Dehalococcoidia bacterium]
MKYQIHYEGKEDERSVLENSPRAILDETERVGEQEPGWLNRLVLGDCLPVLKSLYLDPEVRGNVRLVYIDPPYSTKQTFETKKLWYRPDAASNGKQYAYSDELGGAAYIEFLRKRLIFLREVLSDDGSIYVHLDDNMAFAVKIIMDEIFGAKNFRNWITRRKCSTKNYTRYTYGNISDYILFYTKSDRYVWHRPYEKWDEDRIRKEYNRVERETGRRYKLVPIHAQETRRGATGGPWRGMLPPPGKHWQYTPEKLDEFDRRGQIVWSPTGNPRKKVYFDPSSKGVPLQDTWSGFRDAINQNMALTGYPTEKNLDLLKLIVATSSDEDDLVLDAFVGSGTTCEAAAELGRRWIGIDNSEAAIDTAKRRLASLLSDEEQMQGRLELGDEYGGGRHRHFSFSVLQAMEPVAVRRERRTASL